MRRAKLISAVVRRSPDRALGPTAGLPWFRGIGLLLCLMTAALVRAQPAGPVVGFQKLRVPPGQHDLDARLSAFALEAGTISSVANGRLLSAGSRWETNRWANHQLLITTGPGAGLLYAIRDNTESQLSVEPDPLGGSVVLVGARFEILPNVEDDFGVHLAAGDGVGVINGETNGQRIVWKDIDGQWRDSGGNPATLPLLPGQQHRLAPGAEREVVISGRVLWAKEE